MEGLKDIKPNVTIVDYQFFIFLALVLIVFTLILYLLFKHLRKKEPIELQKLKTLNFADSKEVAYKFCEYARKFVNENNQTAFNHICEELKEYKYKRKVPPLKEELKEKILSFIKEIE